MLCCGRRCVRSACVGASRTALRRRSLAALIDGHAVAASVLKVRACRCSGVHAEAGDRFQADCQEKRGESARWGD